MKMKTYVQRILGINGTKQILMGLALAVAMMLAKPVMAASPAPVDLRSCAGFAILSSGAGTTTTGGGIINGDVGLYPAGSQGIPPAQINGNVYNGDAGGIALQAQADLTTAYNDAAGRSLNRITKAGNIGGQTLAPGLYWSASSLQITGDLTLDAGGDPNAVWIFQMTDSTLTTAAGAPGAPGSRVILAGGAAASNIFWQVGSSATIGTYSVFKGTIMAQASITMNTDSTIDGRALARTGAVVYNGASGSLPTNSTGPIAVDDTATTSTNTPVTIDVLLNDKDADGDTLTVTWVTNGLHGAVVTNVDGTVRYTPVTGYEGVDTFTYTISDGHGNVDSASVIVTIGDVIIISDVDMFLAKMQCHINWARHLTKAAGGGDDQLVISGKVNPRGATRRQEGATMVLDVNGVELLPPVILDNRGRASGVSLDGITYKFKFDWLSGAYSLTLKGLDLRTTIGVTNETATILQDLSMDLSIEGENLDIPLVVGTFECPSSTKVDNRSNLSFNSQLNRTLTGLYQCNSTLVTQHGATHSIKVKGVIEAEDGGAVVPNGDITIKIGDATFIVPFDQLVGDGTVWTYRNHASPGVTRFTLNDRKHAFILNALDMAGTGIPLSGPGEPVSHRLQVQLQVPTADGPMVFDSVVEILRANDQSKIWVR